MICFDRFKLKAQEAVQESQSVAGGETKWE